MRKDVAIVLFFVLWFAMPSAALDGGLETGVRLFQARKYGEAQIFFSDFIKNHPGEATAAYYLGRISLIGSDFEAAIKWFEQAVRGEKDNALYHL
jgi:TolA-binding protein